LSAKLKLEFLPMLWASGSTHPANTRPQLAWQNMALVAGREPMQPRPIPVTGAAGNYRL